MTVLRSLLERTVDANWPFGLHTRTTLLAWIKDLPIGIFPDEGMDKNQKSTITLEDPLRRSAHGPEVRRLEDEPFYCVIGRSGGNVAKFDRRWMPRDKAREHAEVLIRNGNAKVPLFVVKIVDVVEPVTPQMRVRSPIQGDVR